MSTATVKELKNELNEKSPKELIEICLRLSKFKKENKELLTYLLFEIENENEYISRIKKECSELLNQLNTNSYYYINKSVRKVLRILKKYIRYSQKKETEIELLCFFCEELKQINPSIHHHQSLHNLYLRQIKSIEKSISTLHEDLQYDYSQRIEKIK